MTNYRAKLKVHLSSAAHCLRVNFGELQRSRGLHDFLIDTSEEDWSPQAVAAAALDELCARDGGSMDRAILVGVVDFLDQAMGRPDADKQGYRRLKDLDEMLRGGAARPAILKWVDTWYPG